MDPTPLHLAVLSIAGVAAGILGTAGGITSPLGLGALAGGLIGPRVMRRAPRTPVRIAIAVLALGLAVWLLLQAVLAR